MFFADRLIDDPKGKTLEWHEPKCPVCGEVIDQNDPQGPQTMVVEGRSKQVCVDCYFNSFGKVLDEHPIVGPRGPRGCA
jgi:hypothetical protein